MTFKPQPFPDHLYFITGSLVGWRPLFAQPEFAALMLDSLAWHRQHQRWTLYAYVIMPTHFHLIIKPSGGQTITTNLQSFGSFTAHAILKHLRAGPQQAELRYFATHRQADATEKHQVWQPLQAKNIYSPEFLREKVEYIHNNPIAKRWAYLITASPHPQGLTPAAWVDARRASRH
jgi:REP element-mobilizing transposase RayT